MSRTCAPDRASGDATRGGLAIVSDFGAEARLDGNEISAAPAGSARSWTRRSSTAVTIEELRRAQRGGDPRRPAASGAYVASPTFAQYGYSWLRDGSFIADAMSRVGEVGKRRGVLRLGRARSSSGQGFDARYTLEGEREPATWPQRQHDGWGLWLWAVREHCGRHGGGEPLEGAAGATAA